MITNKTLSQFSNKTKHTVYLNKKTFLNKNVNILSSSPIHKPINYKNYMNIDISSSYMENEQTYVVAFKSQDYLKELKKYMNHPYLVSTVKISDVLYYLQKSNNNLLLISDCFCDVVEKSTNYTMIRVDIDSMNSKEEKIPISIHKIIF